MKEIFEKILEDRIKYLTEIRWDSYQTQEIRDEAIKKLERLEQLYDDLFKL